MKLKIIYEGNTYTSIDDDRNFEDAYKVIWDDLENFKKLTMTLKSGAKIMLCKEALQRAILILEP